MRAVIADDERLMREQLRSRLETVWPDLQIVGEARDGREAVEFVAQLRPDVVFLDIRMPLLTGIEAASHIVALPEVDCELVFVTAYDEYAIAAFERGAIDYLHKPVEADRLERTVARIRARRHADSGNPESTLAGAVQPPGRESLAERVAALEHSLARAPQRLRWLQASQGAALKLIDVDEVLVFRSDEKYTAVRTATSEFLIRTPLRELLDQLDGDHFWQVHRGAVVNVRGIDRVVRDDAGHMRVCLRGIDDVVEVSRSYQSLFRQM